MSGRRQRMVELTERRRDAMTTTRRYWPRLDAAGRSYLLVHRSRLWSHHPAAMQVERSAEARLAKLNGRARK